MYRLTIAGIIGIIGGIIGSMFGISGAFIIIPLLLFSGLCPSQISAQGTTLCMLLPPISIFAAYTYYKAGHVDLELSFLLILFYIIGTLFGSRIAVGLGEKTLRTYFSLLLVCLAAYVYNSN